MSAYFTIEYPNGAVRRFQSRDSVESEIALYDAVLLSEGDDVVAETPDSEPEPEPEPESKTEESPAEGDDDGEDDGEDEDEDEDSDADADE